MLSAKNNKENLLNKVLTAIWVSLATLTCTSWSLWYELMLEKTPSKNLTIGGEFSWKAETIVQQKNTKIKKNPRNHGITGK